MLDVARRWQSLVLKSLFLSVPDYSKYTRIIFSILLVSDHLLLTSTSSALSLDFLRSYNYSSALSLDYLRSHNHHCPYFNHRNHTMFTERKQSTGFLSLPTELRHQILLLAIRNFDKNIDPSFRWPKSRRKADPAHLWDIQSLETEIVEVAITRRLAFYIWKNSLILVHADIADDLVYAVTQILNNNTKSFGTRCGRWDRWWNSNIAKGKIIKFGVRDPARLLARNSTYRRVGSSLLKKFDKMPQIEMRALIEKKDIPNLIENVLESLGLEAKSLSRGATDTIEKFNVLTFIQHGCEDMLSATSMQIALPSRTRGEQGIASGKVAPAKKTKADVNEPDRRHASYSGSYHA